jgi:hypothetical protein
MSRDMNPDMTRKAREPDDVRLPVAGGASRDAG